MNSLISLMNTETLVPINNSGGDLLKGDVVVVDVSLANAITTTTIAGFVNGKIGVLLEDIADGARGAVATSGYVPQINLSSSASLGDMVATHTVAGQGARHASPRVAGDFAQVLGTGTSPAAILFGSPTPELSTGGGSLGIELDYVEITSTVTPTATTEGTANTIITANEITLDGTTEIMIEFFSPIVRPDSGGADRFMTLVLYENGASIGKIGAVTTPDTGDDSKPVHCFRRLTPTADDYTYSIRGYVGSGTGSVGAGAGGNGNVVPAFIRITKANP